MPDRPHVLIVDDKLESRTRWPTARRPRVRRARDRLGREALAALDRGGVDLLVTDLRMPEIDGLALLDAARARGDVPVIVMTAYGAMDSAVEAIRKGAYHYLTKPFKLDELLLFVDARWPSARCGARRRS